MASQKMSLAMAEQEMEAITDLFNRVMTTCQKKCIPPVYKESDLSKAESVCVDRCVSKYLEVHERIGKKMADLQQAAMPAQ